jgi:hypothetical protein
LDGEFTATGEYHAEIDDPEHCNPFATSAWEFALLMVRTTKKQNQIELVFER